MAFGTLTVGADTFNSVGPGEYMKSTVLFGQPADMFKLAPGKKANAKAPTSFAVTKVLDKDFTVGTEVTRRRASVSVQINVPDGFTMAEVDTMLLSVSDLCTQTFLTRLALGES